MRKGLTDDFLFFGVSRESMPPALRRGGGVVISHTPARPCGRTDGGTTGPVLRVEAGTAEKAIGREHHVS